MTLTLKRLTLCVAACAVAAGGCAKQESTMEAPPRVSPEPQLPEDPAERITALSRAANEFAERARRLPGGSAEQDRQLVADAFEAGAAALRLLARDEPGGAFLQQMRIVENSAQQVRGAPGELSVEPTTDAGLRATLNALTAVRDRGFTADAPVGEALDAFRQRVTELDTVRGPLHRLSVAQAFNAAAEVARRMSASLVQRAAQMNAAPAR